MKALMYHYVREFNELLPNFRFLDIANFRKQLDFFDKEFGFVEKDEWSNFIDSGEMPKKSGKVVLTFDDAMSCHYDYVFPELMGRGLWGIFYVPAQPYIEQKILDVHRIHLLCGALDGKSLLEVALSLINDEMIPGTKVDEFHRETYTRQHNLEGVSEFKRIMNYYIDYQYRELIIDQIAGKFGYFFDADRFYVPEVALEEMRNSGMVIGSHSYSHPVMSKLTVEEQRSELTKSFEALEDLIGSKDKTYCHPYGGFHSFNGDTVRILNEMDVRYSFNVEGREIVQEDWASSKQHLPRYDCNLFAFGKAS